MAARCQRCRNPPVPGSAARLATDEDRQAPRSRAAVRPARGIHDSRLLRLRHARSHSDLRDGTSGVQH